MKISDIRENVFAEDKSIVAVRLECSIRYIDFILRGERNSETDMAQEILTELERMATINIIANGEKNGKLVAAGRILFGRPLSRKSSSPKTQAA